MVNGFEEPEEIYLESVSISHSYTRNDKPHHTKSPLSLCPSVPEGIEPYWFCYVYFLMVSPTNTRISTRRFRVYVTSCLDYSVWEFQTRQSVRYRSGKTHHPRSYRGEPRIQYLAFCALFLLTDGLIHLRHLRHRLLEPAPRLLDPDIPRGPARGHVETEHYYPNQKYKTPPQSAREQMSLYMCGGCTPVFTVHSSYYHNRINVRLRAIWSDSL